MGLLLAFLFRTQDFVILSERFRISEQRAALLPLIRWSSCSERDELLQDFVTDGHAEIVGVVDAMEQRIRRPKNGQRTWYSGKKKYHTIKSQIVVDPGENS
jgi:hypothetical protein